MTGQFVQEKTIERRIAQIAWVYFHTHVKPDYEELAAFITPYVKREMIRERLDESEFSGVYRRIVELSYQLDLLNEEIRAREE